MATCSGSRFSVRYIADCLRKQPTHVMALVDAFLQRFDPRLSAAQRAGAAEALAGCKARLSKINHVDTEEILGSLGLSFGMKFDSQGRLIAPSGTPAVLGPDEGIDEEEDETEAPENEAQPGE